MQEIVENSINRADKDIEVFTVWYNRDQHVDRSIDSLLQQTSSNFSIFAVDDGSNDNTFDKLVEKVDDAADAGIPMRVWGKKNQGFTTSLKRAIEEHSDSKIIALHGAGDISKERRIAEQSTVLQEKEDVIAVGVASEVINPSGVVLATKTRSEYQKYDLENDILPRPGSHGDSMYYRKYYQKCGGYGKQFKYGQDTDLWLRLGNYGKFYQIQEVCYQQLKSPETIQGSGYEKRIEQIMCSGAAIKSAKYRANGKRDPINAVSEYDYTQICNIAKKEGLPKITLRSILILAIRLLLRRDLYSFILCMGNIPLKDYPRVLEQIPYIAKKGVGYLHPKIKQPF